MKPARGAGRAWNNPRIVHGQVQPRIGQGDDLALAGLHFHDIGFDLGEERVVQGQSKGGKGRVNKRDGPVLHFTGGIAFGVDVGQFLELEAPSRARGKQCPRPR